MWPEGACGAAGSDGSLSGSSPGCHKLSSTCLPGRGPAQRPRLQGRGQARQPYGARGALDRGTARGSRSQPAQGVPGQRGVRPAVSAACSQGALGCLPYSQWPWGGRAAPAGALQGAGCGGAPQLLGCLHQLYMGQGPGLVHLRAGAQHAGAQGRGLGQGFRAGVSARGSGQGLRHTAQQAQHAGQGGASWKKGKRKACEAELAGRLCLRGRDFHGVAQV